MAGPTIRVQVLEMVDQAQATTVRVRLSGLQSQRGELVFSRRVVVEEWDPHQLAQELIRDVLEDLEAVHSALIGGEYAVEVVSSPALL